MGTGQSTPIDETPDEPNQGGFVQDLFSYPPLSMPIDQTSNRPDRYYSQDPFNYPTPSMPTDQTPNEPNQGYFQDPSNYPPRGTPIDQTPNEPNQGYFQDPFYYPPLSTPIDQTPNEPNQGYFQYPFYYPHLSTPVDQAPNEPNQGYFQSPFYYPHLSTPVDQTPNEPNQGYFQYPFYYPPHRTPTGQAPNETNQGYFQDPFYYPPFSMPIDQTPNQLVQGYLQDPFNYPSMNMLTDQTPSGPVQGYSQDGSNPALGRLPDQNRKCFSCMIPEPTGEEYTKVDVRYLCSNCLSISIMEPRQLKPVIRQVYTFFEEYLKLPVKRDIPIFLVKTNGFIDCEPDLIGPGRPGVGEFLCQKSTIEIVKRCVRRGAEIEAITKTKKVKAEPTIVLLFCLPKQILGGALVGRMVHTLISLQDWPFTLERDVEDSICQAVIFKWLRYTGDIIHNNNDPSYKTQKDAQFALYLTMILGTKMKNNDGVPCSPASFWKARHAIEKYGLKDTLRRVALARSIPE